MFSKRVVVCPSSPATATLKPQSAFNYPVNSCVELSQNGNLVKKNSTSDLAVAVRGTDVSEEDIEDRLADLQELTVDELNLIKNEPAVESVQPLRPRTESVTGRVAICLSHRLTPHRPRLLKAAFSDGFYSNFDGELPDDVWLFALTEELVRLREKLREANDWGDLSECSDLLSEIARNREDQREVRERMQQSSSERQQRDGPTAQPEQSETREYKKNTPAEEELARIEAERLTIFDRMSAYPFDHPERDPLRRRLKELNMARLSVLGRNSIQRRQTTNHHRTVRADSTPQPHVRGALQKIRKAEKPQIGRFWTFLFRGVLGRAGFLFKIGFGNRKR